MLRLRVKGLYGGDDRLPREGDFGTPSPQTENQMEHGSVIMQGFMGAGVGGGNLALFKIPAYCNF